MRLQLVSFVYLMRNERNGFIKIGKSDNPRYREKTLQSEEPEVSLIFAHPCPIWVEKGLHVLFSEKRLRGEWFSLSEDEIGLAETIIQVELDCFKHDLEHPEDPINA